MTRDVVAVRPALWLTDAIKVMLEHNVSAGPVVDAGQELAGIITEYDIMNSAFSGNAAETTVAEVMFREVVTCAPDTDVETLVNFCAKRRMHRVTIVEGRKVVGMVSRRDILREIAWMYNEY